MKVGIKQDLRLKSNKWHYEIKFSDNSYTMVYENDDICKCQNIQAIMNNRITKFFKKETNELKTSDLGFTYIK